MHTMTRTHGTSRAISLSAAAVDLFHSVSEALRRRRERRELMALDDRMLADIGISRADIPRLTGTGE